MLCALPTEESTRFVMEWRDEPGLMASDHEILTLPCIFLSRFLIHKLLMLTKKLLMIFFAKLGALYTRLNLLSKPMQIFNVEETGISVVHKTEKVITQIGCKNVWSITSAEKGKHTHSDNLCGCFRFCYPTDGDIP